jgi:hypothetical protein
VGYAGVVTFNGTPGIPADTGPINYLILIGHVAMLPVLFGKVIFRPWFGSRGQGSRGRCGTGSPIRPPGFRSARRR